MLLLEGQLLRERAVMEGTLAVILHLLPQY
jgi:hypothetical protein